MPVENEEWKRLLTKGELAELDSVRQQMLTARQEYTVAGELFEAANLELIVVARRLRRKYSG
jgi:hypothetical protein